MARLAAFDMDGTLLMPDHRLGDQTLATLRRLRDRDEFPDDQAVSDEVEMIAHAAGDEMLRPARVVIVAVVADRDQRVVDHRLQEGRAFPARDRVARARIG